MNIDKEIFSNVPIFNDYFKIDCFKSYAYIDENGDLIYGYEFDEDFFQEPIDSNEPIFKYKCK